MVSHHRNIVAGPDVPQSLARNRLHVGTTIEKGPRDRSAPNLDEVLSTLQVTALALRRKRTTTSTRTTS